MRLKATKGRLFHYTWKESEQDVFWLKFETVSTFNEGAFLSAKCKTCGVLKGWDSRPRSRDSGTIQTDIRAVMQKRSGTNYRWCLNHISPTYTLDISSSSLYLFPIIATFLPPRDVPDTTLSQFSITDFISPYLLMSVQQHCPGRLLLNMSSVLLSAKHVLIMSKPAYVPAMYAVLLLLLSKTHNLFWLEKQIVFSSITTGAW